MMKTQKNDMHPTNNDSIIKMLLPVMTKSNPAARASIVFSRSGEVVTNLWDPDEWRSITDANLKSQAEAIRKSGYQAVMNPSNTLWKDLQSMDPNKISVVVDSPSGAPKAEPESTAKPKDKINVVELVKKWFDFFSEFTFEPQVRFINSIVRMTTVDDIRDYVVGYFELTNNSFAKDVHEKTKSPEFISLAEQTAQVTTDKQINKRLRIKYGAPGTGKTTISVLEYPNAKVVICHPQMGPDELFRGFDFQEEKDAKGNVIGSHPIFRPCALREAMEQGLVVILDEINLLTPDCLRTLQAVTDAKTEVTINNEIIHIKDGFKVVGTMNLEVGDMICPLPDPLVDRCEAIKRYALSYKDVAAMAI